MSDTHLQINAVSKQFGSMNALRDVSMSIERGAFVCLLGPSGCGKTTLLRIIAGFEAPSSGQLLLDGEDITGLPAHKRGFGMVFQSLALFPHMSVANNIAYGLKLRRVGKTQRRNRVEELLHIIDLPNIADRAVSELSGGQRQRVAIARALAVQPKLFLLDEPLSALDAKLRDNMQIELRRLQQKFGVTTVLVTHDQTEAMMLADELVVLKDGVVRQSGQPTEVYRNPRDSFVADFLGSANIIKGKISEHGTLMLFGADLGLETDFPAGAAVTVALRSENIHLVKDVNAQKVLKGRVELIRDLGPLVEWIVSVNGVDVQIKCRHDDSPAVCVGDDIGLKLDLSALSIYAG